MKKVKIEPESRLANLFLEKLKDETSTSHVAIIYAQLFSLRTNEQLQDELEYLQTLYEGTDSYWKENSKDSWFSIWHKSIRQCDYFDNCFQKNTKTLLTKDERAEFKYLLNKKGEPGFSKTDGKSQGELFNETYKRLLHLSEIDRREDIDDSISGKLDSILWHTVHLDKEGLLAQAFEYVFTH